MSMMTFNEDTAIRMRSIESLFSDAALHLRACSSLFCFVPLSSIASFDGFVRSFDLVSYISFSLSSTQSGILNALLATSSVDVTCPSWCLVWRRRPLELTYLIPPAFCFYLLVFRSQLSECFASLLPLHNAILIRHTWWYCLIMAHILQNFAFIFDPATLFLFLDFTCDAEMNRVSHRLGCASHYFLFFPSSSFFRLILFLRAMYD